MNPTMRVAGWATLGFALTFFATFAINTAINALVAFPEYPSADEMAGMFWYGLVMLGLWSPAGVAIGISAVALPHLVWPDGGLAPRIATLFGAVATTGWLLSGCAALAQRTWLLNDNIAGVGADPAAERAIVEGLFVFVHVGGVLLAVAVVPWLGMVAWRSAGRLPLAVTIALWVAAAAPLAGFAITGAQYGLMGLMLGFAVVGPVLLRRARVATTASLAEGPDAPASVGA